MTRETWEKVKQIAIREERTAAAVIRRAIRLYADGKIPDPNP